MRAFKHPNNLRISWGYQIARLCKSNTKKNLMISEAKNLLQKEISSQEVYRILIDSTKLSDSHDDISTTTYNNINSKVKLHVKKNKRSTSIHINNLVDQKKFNPILSELITIFELTEKEKV